MNEQIAPNGIEWTRVKHLTSIRRGFTWNPVGGCAHECQWQMPDGKIAVCYAKTLAERKMTTVYTKGFAAHYWRPHLLDEPLKLKEPAGIFLDSMSDLMGTQVPDEQVNAVLDVCRQADWHIFMLLTKNAPRLLKFRFPPNVWVGVSSPPDFMFGTQLNERTQRQMLGRSLRILSDVDVPIRWMSFEPLSWDCGWIVDQFPGTLQWAVVGAASDGNRHFPPQEDHLRRLLEVLDDQNCPGFFKGNLDSLDWAARNWREDFPIVERAKPAMPVQLELF